MARLVGSISISEADLLSIRPALYEAVIGNGAIELLEHSGDEVQFSVDVDDNDPYKASGPFLDTLVSKKTSQIIDEASMLGLTRDNIYMRDGWWVKMTRDELTQRALMVKGKIFDKFIEKCDKDKVEPGQVLSNLMLSTIFVDSNEIANQSYPSLDALNVSKSKTKKKAKKSKAKK